MKTKLNSARGQKNGKGTNPGNSWQPKLQG